MSFALHAGEVLGLAGLLGSGRSSLARLLAGIDPAASGTISIKGREVSIRKPGDAIDNGVALVPEARATQGIIPAHSVASNMVLAVIERLSRAGVVDRKAVVDLTDRQIARLSIKTASRDHAVATLSGGNQQKVVIGKWLATDPDILILDEPTAGIDIGLEVGNHSSGAGSCRLRQGHHHDLLGAFGTADRLRPHSRHGGWTRSLGPSPRGFPTIRQWRWTTRRIACRQRSKSSRPKYSGRSQPRRRSMLKAFAANWRQNIIYIGFIAIFVVFAVTLNDKGFLTANNLLNIVRQTAMIAVMAIAITFVLSAGEIDLSVGAVAGLTTVTVAMAIAVGGPFAGVLAGIATGLAVGSFNGWLTTRIGIPSFLTTLAMMGIAKGVAMWISATAAVPILSPGYSWLFGGGNLGRIPVLLVWMLVLGVIGHMVLRRTGFGRRVLATGGGETAARYSGIDTRNIKFKVLVMSSCAAALAGMLYAGRLQSGRFQLGEGDELSVIAAAVLGGTSLFGGKGTVVGTIVGALMIGLINNGLILMGLEFSQQLIARGGIIILAVALSQKKSAS